MVASRNQAHHLMRGFASLPNGSMARYNAPSLGAAPVIDLQKPANLAAIGLIYAGTDFPYAREALRTVRTFWKQPLEVLRAASIVTGVGILALNWGK